MKPTEFKTPKADKVSLGQSKKQLWNYIQKKAQLKLGWYEVLLNFLWKRKGSFAGALATLLIVVLLSTQLPFGLLEPTSVQASFEMTADQQDESGIEPETSFTLKSDQKLNPKVIEEHLRVDPAIDFEVKKTGDDFKIIPKEPLETNGLYHFSIISEIDGKKTEFSWVYQVKDTFKITGSLPGDKTNGVPVTSGIELYFSHENYDFEAVKDYFQISPATEGHFENHHRTLVFVPKNHLKGSALYTVTLKKGLKLKETDQRLKEDYRFQFTTNIDDSLSSENLSESGPNMRFMNTTQEVAENKPIGLSTYDNYQFYGGEEDPSKTIAVKVYRFKDIEEYTQTLQGMIELPAWARNWIQDQNNYLKTVDVDKMEFIGEMEAIRDSKPQGGSYLYLPTAELEKGYYLFEIKNSSSSGSRTLLQITNLSAYFEFTKEKSLVWVNDLKSGQPLPEAKVELLGVGPWGKTSKEGLLDFKIPEKEKEFQKEGGIIKVTSPKGEALVQLFQPNFNLEQGKGDYWYSFSTDRPIYKANDVVRFWGFIKPKKEGASTKDLKLKLMKGSGYSATPILLEEKEVKLNKEGTFKDVFELNNLSPGYFSIGLYQADTLLSENTFSIQNYIKPAYQISVEPDRKGVVAGETIRFEVASNFFDGTPVPHLKLNSSEGMIKTDEEGKATVEIKTVAGEGDVGGNPSIHFLSVSAKQGEEGEIYASSSPVRVFHSKLALKSQGQVDGKQAKITTESYKVDVEKFEKEGWRTEDYFGELAPSQKIEGRITEVTWKKIESGTFYNFITKKTEKQYSYEPVEKELPSFNFTTNEKGKGSYEFPIEAEKHYRVELKAYDDEGHFTSNQVYIYGDMETEEGFDYFYATLPENNLGGQKNFDLGEKVEVQIGASGLAGRFNLPMDTPGKFLFFQLNNGLMEEQLMDDPAYSFKMEEKNLPGTYVGGVWFDGKRYIPIQSASVAYKKELRKLSIEMDTDKTSYQPGDQVKMKVKVKDATGKGTKAEVNLNLVDEAYYKVAYDYLQDPLDDLYHWSETGEILSYGTHKTPFEPFFDPGGKGGCFVAGTKILMADGSYKAIEEIQKGDFILTRESYFSDQLVSAEVKNTIRHEVGNYLIINEKLKVTGEHMIFVNQKFMRADQIKLGDFLINKNNQWVKVASIRFIQEPVSVYNFEVAEKHTYFADDFYVHNDKGGDGIRNEFEDNALFDVVKTNANGEGSITFQLPDNITSWRVTAKAIDGKNLQAGMNVGAVKVSLPLFGDLVMNSQYSVKDEPVIKFRAYGDKLKKGDSIEFKLRSSTLKLQEILTGKAFENAYLALPPLTQGQHEVILEAKSASLSDAMSQPIEVVGSRLSQNRIEFVPQVESEKDLKMNEINPTEVTFVDAGRGVYYNLLMNLAYGQGERLDQKLSEQGAKELIQNYFFKNNVLPKEPDFENYKDPSYGLRLLPYSEKDLKLTTLAIAMDPKKDRFNTAEMKAYFETSYKNPESNLEEVVLALLGLATLKEPVLNSLNQLQNEPELSTEDQLRLGLAFNTLGDKEKAEKMYFAANQGSASTEEKAETKALRAVLAAALNQEKRNELWQRAAEAVTNDDLLSLYQLGFLKYVLPSSNANPAEFKWTRNGLEDTVTLERGKSYSALIFPDDKFNLELLQGKISAILHSSDPLEISNLKSSDQMSIERSYWVNGVETDQWKEGDTVTVLLKISAPVQNKQEVEQLGADGILSKVSLPTKEEREKIFHIMDILPSGLAPVSSSAFYQDQSQTLWSPYDIEGQKMNFIWRREFLGEIYSNEKGEELYSGPYTESVEIRYLARVIHPGKFYADPAKVELFEKPQIASFSQEDWVRIERME